MQKRGVASSSSAHMTQGESPPRQLSRLRGWGPRRCRRRFGQVHMIRDKALRCERSTTTSRYACRAATAAAPDKPSSSARWACRARNLARATASELAVLSSTRSGADRHSRMQDHVDGDHGVERRLCERQRLVQIALLDRRQRLDAQRGSTRTASAPDLATTNASGPQGAQPRSRKRLAGVNARPSAGKAG